ncbi:hypothetical protein PILCRDRAFT_443268 [Piloderma croceum F 1598]|uniref:Uncharacterized protein n=1 Tax=Piloderma croceum (strain F 1598) TaxID=765440 RepID=A0A0C3C1D4_PILCF|nr:hypothetical protein PILCRDRAFT_443268 [Piloderma croceum F 1598]
MTTVLQIRSVRLTCMQEVFEGENLSQQWRGLIKRAWDDAATLSLGKICGAIMSLKFKQYGSLKPDASTKNILGPRIDPTLSLHRHRPIADTGPWPVSQPVGPFLALATRELQWLESETGRQLFDEYRQKMHPNEDRSKTPSVP